MEALPALAEKQRQTTVPVVFVPAAAGRQKPEEIAMTLVETILKEEILGKKSR